MKTDTSALIQQIIAIEWAQFSKVQNSEGPANCQNHPATFFVMRAIQASIWQDLTLQSYLHDLTVATNNNHNMMTEKYARMMEATHSAEYQQIKDYLPVISPQKQQLVDEIMTFFTYWQQQAVDEETQKFIAAVKNESALTYLHGELLTYSIETLQLCLHDVQEASKTHRNLVKEIFAKTIAYYQSLQDSKPTEQAKETDLGKSDQSSSSARGCCCHSCGIEIPIDNTTSLANLTSALLNYDLPKFYH